MTTKINFTALYAQLILCFVSLWIKPEVSLAITPLEQAAIAQHLGWVQSSQGLCGGYYLEQPLPYPPTTHQNNAVTITSGGGVLSQHQTSLLEKTVTISRTGQQITANKAYLYRDPVTDKLSMAEMLGNVRLREPNSLVTGKKGRYYFENKSKSLFDILYRITLDASKSHAFPEQEQKITALTAWGKASEFAQTTPKVNELFQASYSTCPPINPTWRVQASHIVLNKNTGRGYATHAKLLVKEIPILYVPYINFPIDKQRKTGFLWPTLGTSNKWGPYILTPFYWNIAPNYDATFTPGLLTKRGLKLDNQFRYLTTTSRGYFDLDFLPNDNAFKDFQDNTANNPIYLNPANPVTQAELRRLLQASPSRMGFIWRDDSHFNDHWSTHIDINYASDDYYLRDFGQTLNEISKNYLLQEASFFYKDPYWDFTTRLQGYQTLHPIDEAFVLNQYRRFPQLSLNGNFPDLYHGLTFFIINDLTHFDLLKTPGTEIILPIGNRLHVQPGVSLPLYWPSFYMTPRFQTAFTDYQLTQTTETNTPNHIKRAIPIFDIVSGLSVSRDIHFFKSAYQQTLEPQLYYTYIPYQNQAEIPTFDTTVNTLTYDQIFNYNRFTSIDRIGDANQLGIGVTTRLIDQETGYEKIRLGAGEILYFANRRVTLCNDDSCSDNPSNPTNNYSLSPVSGFLNYHINPIWSVQTNAIWNPITKQLDNTTFAFQYHPDVNRLINVGYTYARSGDVLSGISTTNSANNLKVTDVSIAWPISENLSATGRWSQNWNHDHLQNLLYGLQYDTCCWAARFVGGRAFVGFNPNENNKPQYNNEYYIQFSLKGLGDIGSGNPGGLLSGIPGYQSHFGQDKK
jgi:LPS-assembly protein